MVSNADAKRAVRQIASKQLGLVSRQQALECALSPSTIKRLVTNRELIPTTTRVLALPGSTDSPERRTTAALLHCPDGALSHHTALTKWGVTLDQVTSQRTHVTSNNTGRHGDPEAHWLALHRSRTMRPEDIAHTSIGLVTQPARCLADLARGTSFARLQRYADALIDRKVMTIEGLQSIVEHLANRHWDGLSKLRAIVACTEQQQPIGRKFLEIVKLSGLPLPRPEHRYLLSNGQVAFADFAWPELGLVIELDGFAIHGRRSAFEADRVRGNELNILGLSVLRFTWRQLHDTPDLVTRQLRSNYEARVTNGR